MIKFSFLSLRLTSRLRFNFSTRSSTVFSDRDFLDFFLLIVSSLWKLNSGISPPSGSLSESLELLKNQKDESRKTMNRILKLNLVFFDLMASCSLILA